MGRLIVMRHGKAGELPGGPDFERALRSRGRTDAAAAGRWLRAGGYVPELVLCSAARRARQTWQYVAEGLAVEPSPVDPSTVDPSTADSGTVDSGPGAPAPEVLTEEALYGADADDLAGILRAIPAGAGTVMYVGHNPAAAELVAMLTGAEPDFPTAAIAVIAVPGDWADLAAGQHDLLDVWTPAAATS
jgi:phosphohistidine phosphatase